jgi:NAD(P)H-nitrite reductase large subunit
MGEPLVVVGNGMAATRFVDELMRRALGRYSVIVIGAEPRLSYNRVLLSSLLADEVDEAAIELKPRGWWTKHGVTTLYGQAVGSIDRRARIVTLPNGQYFTFSKLVLATGSLPIRLPKPGMNLHTSSLPRSHRRRRHARLGAAGRASSSDRRRLTRARGCLWPCQGRPESDPCPFNGPLDGTSARSSRSAP